MNLEWLHCSVFHFIPCPSSCLMREQILSGEARITSTEVVARCFEVAIMLACSSNCGIDAALSTGWMSADKRVKVSRFQSSDLLKSAMMAAFLIPPLLGRIRNKISKYHRFFFCAPSQPALLTIGLNLWNAVNCLDLWVSWSSKKDWVLNLNHFLV